jgi:hypothetical protein
MLKQLFEGQVTSTTKWRDVQDIFEGSEIWSKSQPIDQLTAFEEFVKHLDKEEYLLSKE